MFLLLFFKKINFIEVELIYSVVLISMLLFLILIRPAPQTPPHRPGCRLWIPCRPCPAAPEAPAPCPPRSRRPGRGRVMSHGWRGGCSAHGHRVAQRFICWTESREYVGWAGPAGSAGPGWALGGRSVLWGDRLSGGGAGQPRGRMPSGGAGLCLLFRDTI